MPKVHLSFSSPALQRRCRGFAAALSFVLGEELKSLREHPRYAKWQSWGDARPASLGLLICGDEEIRTYNRDYRKMDKATDVLSFPAHEASAEPAPGMEGYLGDLIISLETVERAAVRVKRPLTDEFVEVFVHGVLHLLGFDHLVGKGVTKRDAVEMKSLQAELFKKLRAPIKKRYGSFVQKR
ncbi:MAG TPA: rRNA maturation RNase YbeY [Bdellovibrionota bacterium]|nr:rRNA maturation RNase YbeY [Bdellovibrionota bacterium]